METSEQMYDSTIKPLQIEFWLWRQLDFDFR